MPTNIDYGSDAKFCLDKITSSVAKIKAQVRVFLANDIQVYDNFNDAKKAMQALNQKYGSEVAQYNEVLSQMQTMPNENKYFSVNGFATMQDWTKSTLNGKITVNKNDVR